MEIPVQIKAATGPVKKHQTATMYVTQPPMYRPAVVVRVRELARTCLQFYGNLGRTCGMVNYFLQGDLNRDGTSLFPELLFWDGRLSFDVAGRGNRTATDSSAGTLGHIMV